jgi:hypothetical protein
MAIAEAVYMRNAAEQKRKQKSGKLHESYSHNAL